MARGFRMITIIVAIQATATTSIVLFCPRPYHHWYYNHLYTVLVRNAIVIIMTVNSDHSYHTHWCSAIVTTIICEQSLTLSSLQMLPLLSQPMLFLIVATSLLSKTLLHCGFGCCNFLCYCYHCCYGDCYYYQCYGTHCWSYSMLEWSKTHCPCQCPSCFLA